MSEVSRLVRRATEEVQTIQSKHKEQSSWRTVNDGFTRKGQLAMSDDGDKILWMAIIP